MCFGGSPKMPDVAVPAAPPPLPTPVDPAVKQARNDQKNRAIIAGANSTTATSAMGDTSQANTGYKTLMGM